MSTSTERLWGYQCDAFCDPAISISNLVWKCSLLFICFLFSESDSGFCHFIFLNNTTQKISRKYNTVVFSSKFSLSLLLPFFNMGIRSSSGITDYQYQLIIIMNFVLCTKRCLIFTFCPSTVSANNRLARQLAHHLTTVQSVFIQFSLCHPLWTSGSVKLYSSIQNWYSNKIAI